MYSVGFSWSDSTYLGLLIAVLGGMKYRPRHDLARLAMSSLFFLHHLWRVWLSCRPVYSSVEIELELIAVPFKREIARIFLQELITVRLNGRSSLGVVFRGRPDVFLS